MLRGAMRRAIRRAMRRRLRISGLLGSIMQRDRCVVGDAW